MLTLESSFYLEKKSLVEKGYPKLQNSLLCLQIRGDICAITHISPPEWSLFCVIILAFNTETYNGFQTYLIVMIDENLLMKLAKFVSKLEI